MNTQTVNMTALGDFIEQEIKQKFRSARQLALAMDVDPTTITKAMSFADPPVPSLDFLAKLARVTRTDICTLVGMVYPDEVRMNARTRLIAERIEQLSPEQQEIVDTYLIGLSLKDRNQTT
jgi:transcriptional regulator with XRE-family HTH domain